MGRLDDGGRRFSCIQLMWPFEIEPLQLSAPLLLTPAATLAEKLAQTGALEIRCLPSQTSTLLVLTCTDSAASFSREVVRSASCVTILTSPKISSICSRDLPRGIKTHQYTAAVDPPSAWYSPLVSGYPNANTRAQRAFVRTKRI